MFRQCSQYELDLEFAAEDLLSFEPDFGLADGPVSSMLQGDLLDAAIDALS
jgi:hypothetical protein